MKIRFQRGHMYKDDRRLGLIFDKKNNEKLPTIDICWWWGWVMIYFTKQ